MMASLSRQQYSKGEKQTYSFCVQLYISKKLLLTEKVWLWP